MEELEEQLNPTIKCPKCASKNLQFMQNNKKAFSVGKAAGGAILTGGVGALAGFAGKKAMTNGDVIIVEIFLQLRIKSNQL